MKCPYCGYSESKVIDSRPADENSSIRRRRECLSCGKRFTTYETVESLPMVVIKKDGTIEHSGVSLNAPSFKFYQPKNGAENDLQISLTKDGFAFQIEPDKNDAIVFVDIPYAAVKLENAKADAAGNLVFSGNIGFRTIFNGAEFSMEKLGYGLNAKNNEFKVNGVKATGSFDTAKLMALELASISGEVNTFKGERFNQKELEQQLRRCNSFAQMMARSELDSGVKRPLLPLSISQIGLIGGSGMINGLIACDTPHIIKGRIVKVIRTESEEKFSAQGNHIGSEVKETITNKMIFNVLTPNGFKALT